MEMLHRLKFLLPSRRRAAEREMQEELDSLAAIAGRRELGNLTLAAENAREEWSWGWLERLGQDVRYALRMARKTPGFTTVVVASLALGIGANTTLFSLIDTLVIRKLPVDRPDELVQPMHRLPNETHYNGFSWSSYQYFLQHNHVLSGLIATAAVHVQYGPYFNVPGQDGVAQHVDGVCVSGSYFPVLGLKPALGRLIGLEDDRPESPAAVAVVSWSYWENHFDFSPAVLGQHITVENAPVTIVGVAPRGFEGLSIESRQELWLPLAMQPVLKPNGSVYKSHGIDLTLAARLRPGVSPKQAHAEMAILYHQAIEAEPQNAGIRFLGATKFELEPAGTGLSQARDEFAGPVEILLGTVGLLLLIACANIASLLLARGTARRREMALRVSLGAGRWRLARQALTESLLLSIAGTLAGVGLSYFGVRLLVRIIASGRDRLTLHVAPDARVLLFAVLLALLTALLFGAFPVWRAWRTAPASCLRAAGRGGETRRGRLLDRGLVAAQLAFSAGVLGVAGLFIGHIAKVYASLGFERGHVLLIALDPSHSGLSNAQLALPYRELLERLQALPQVRSATLSATTPTLGLGTNRDVTVEGYQDKPGELRYVFFNRVGPKFFETFGTPLLRGRDFTFEDQGRVAVVNQALARHYFGNADPLGRHFTFDGDPKPFEIVGVVGDSRYIDAREAPPRTVYLSSFQEGSIYSRFSLRTRGAPAGALAEFRGALNQVMKGVKIEQVTTLADQVDATLVPERLVVTLAGWAGALGTLLAAIGAYGLLAYSVARRTNEIGVRMALGASRPGIFRMILGEAVGTTCAGLLLGIPVALAARVAAAKLIPGLSPQGPALIALGAILLIAIALFASCLPARRAARIDPMEALRYE